MTEKKRQREAKAFMKNLKVEAEWKKMPIDLQHGYRAGAKDALEIVQLYATPSQEADNIIRKIKKLTK